MIRGLIFAIFAFQVSLATAESFVCPDNHVEYKGVTCCLDAVSRFDCERIVDRLPEVTLAAIEKVRSQSSQGLYAYGRVPNCFWGAAVTTGILPLQDVPSPLQSYELMDLLKATSLATVPPDENLWPGDLLLFEAQGDIREDILENNVPKRVWLPYASLEHAAVYLGGGLLFQKENIGSVVFSIDSVENTRQAYENGWNKSPQFRGQMRVRALR